MGSKEPADAVTRWKEIRLYDLGRAEEGVSRTKKFCGLCKKRCFVCLLIFVSVQFYVPQPTELHLEARRGHFGTSSKLIVCHVMELRFTAGTCGRTSLLMYSVSCNNLSDNPFRIIYYLLR